MKVTFCTYDNPTFTGGPNSWLRRLLPDLRQSGINIQVLFFIDAESPNQCPTYQMLTEAGIECISFSVKTSMERKIHWILATLAQRPPDIFVPNMIVAAFYASRWVKEAGIPTIGVLHSDDNFHRGVLEQFVFGNEVFQLSALVCVSEFLTQYVNNIGNTTTKICRISYGVPIPTKQAQSPIKNLKLIYVGRLEEEQKRISEVARGLCQVLKQITNTEATIYGDGSAKPEIEKIIKEEAKHLPIKLGGMVRNDQIQTVMLDTHVLVLLSDYEGLPIALMEAMACGLVPICLAIRSGISELVEDGVTGLLVNNRNDSLVQAVKRLKEEPKLWQTLSKAARTKVESTYSQPDCAEKWLSLLQKLHEKSNGKQIINCPKFLKLPPPNTYLREDDRQIKVLLKLIKQQFKYPFHLVERVLHKLAFHS